MKKAIAAMILLAGGMFAAPAIRVGIGVNFGAPAPVAIVRPVCPGPGYTWVNSFYQPNGAFVAGYWAAPAVRVAPLVRVAPRIAPVRVANHYGRFDGRRFERR
jgi:hypothetical protein